MLEFCDISNKSYFRHTLYMMFYSMYFCVDMYADTFSS